ncbi:KAZD1 protein, partial [Polypterus senegalus]
MSMGTGSDIIDGPGTGSDIFRTRSDVISGAGTCQRALAVPRGPDYLQRGWQRLLEEGENCADCRADECPSPRGCLAGVVLDHCDCCWECANLEGQICDLDNTNHFYGKCGENLECRLDLGDLREGEVPEPQCTCTSNKAVCGSDGKTYPQICKFQEAANAHPTNNLKVQHEGPCEAAPHIVSPPYDIWNVTGEDVIFGCEVFAYPMASIEWRKDGNEMFLPGDDPHISVQPGTPTVIESTASPTVCESRNDLSELKVMITELKQTQAELKQEIKKDIRKSEKANEKASEKANEKLRQELQQDKKDLEKRLYICFEAVFKDMLDKIVEHIQETTSKLSTLADQLEDVKETFVTRIETAKNLAASAEGKATAANSECKKTCCFGRWKQKE